VGFRYRDDKNDRNLKSETLVQSVQFARERTGWRNITRVCPCLTGPQIISACLVGVRALKYKIQMRPLLEEFDR
jgi:hypothetical protein